MHKFSAHSNLQLCYCKNLKCCYEIFLARILLLESLSYARQGRTAVRIPDANGSIVLPESWTNSLIQVMAVNWIKKQH